MDIPTILAVIIAAETSYLTYAHIAKSTPKTSRGRIICDTSALIDGRIVSIARSGFLSNELIVPRSVVRELQYMADKADHEKRERARYGLDVVNELQEIRYISVTLYDDGLVHPEGVDEQLIVLAKKLDAKLCTTDYNLNKVARTEHVAVVNVNELAHALRPMHLPGEVIKVQIVAAGQNKDQGVGYLDDGTMVVVDRAKSAIGRMIEAETTRVLQTEAGRMVFARSRSVPDRPKKTTSTPRQLPYRPATKQSRQTKRTREDAFVDLVNK